jgi:pyruvate dehydrogenase E2 component (dihydrolipoamide acetyltransferase)
MPAEADAPAAATLAVQQAGASRLIATPLARRLARQRGIDLASVAGTGPRGRIKARDVEARAATAPPSTQRGARRAATAFEKTTARRLTEAKRSIPHFYVQADADVTRLLALRDELNAAPGFARLSITHFVAAAAARALADNPALNVVWDDDGIVMLANIDIGIAVDTERGLLVPVLRGANRVSLDGIARAVGDLVARAPPRPPGGGGRPRGCC